MNTELENSKDLVRNAIERQQQKWEDNRAQLMRELRHNRDTVAGATGNQVIIDDPEIS